MNKEMREKVNRGEGKEGRGKREENRERTEQSEMKDG